MDLYRRRPPAQGGDLVQPAMPSEGVHGFCYLAPQAALFFGSTRRHPTEWRPVVSALAGLGRRYVLPATTTRDHAFYPLRRERCFLRRQGHQQTDNWLCPRMEAIEVRNLIELGVLPHAESLRILDWLRERR